MNGKFEMNRWTENKSQNLLSSESLDRVKKAFEDSGIVFGWHYYYAGGCSRTEFVCSSFEKYYSNVNDSNPGDHFTVYAINNLKQVELIRIGNPFSNKLIAISQDLLFVLSGIPDLIIIWRYIDQETSLVECEMETLTEDDREERKQCLLGYKERKGEVRLYLETMLDYNKYHIPITTVSPKPDEKRVYALLDGKRPNDNGETPESGPY